MFAVRSRALPALADGEALVKVAWLGIDATRRTWLNALVAELRAAAPEPLGPAMLAARLGVGERTVHRDLALQAHGGLSARAGRGRGTHRLVRRIRCR